jgi:hypothetical protein
MIAFPNVNTGCLNDNDLPWVPFTPYSNEVHIKYFKVNPVSGEVITLLRAPTTMRLPRHHHTGTVIVYTVSGCWKYLEHDWIARPGSVVYETASTQHTPIALEGGGDTVVTFNITQGELLFLDDAGNTIAVENWRSSLQRYLDHCRANGIAPRDLTAYN